MPGVDRDCVTHHHACECREARFAEIEAENTRLRETLAYYADPAHYERGSFEGGDEAVLYDGGYRAHEALSASERSS